MLRLGVGLAVWVCLAGPARSAPAQGSVDLEFGVAFPGTAEMRVPGDFGTQFSMLDGFDADTASFFRVRASAVLGGRHTFSVLVAPLSFQSLGSFEQNVIFQNQIFPRDTLVRANYHSDSYRLAYRYDLVRREKWDLGLGVTGKLRSMSVQLTSQVASSKKSERSFAPLLNFRLRYGLARWWDLLAEGDVTPGPHGRAEELFLGVRYALRKSFGVKAGYRILEGKSDSDDLYDSSLFHCLAAGVEIRF